MITEVKTKRLYLRPVEESDVTERYLSWLADPAVTEFLESRDITREQAIDYIREGRKTGTNYMYAICYRENDLHIGNLKIGPISKKHRTSDLVTLIGDRDYWGKGLATEAIKLGNNLAFENHDIRKLTGGMHSDNLGSIKCYTRAGWKIEGRLVGHYTLNDKVMDRVCVSCFNPKYFEEQPDGTVVPRDSGN